ncbi:MAG TPA: hypothetical protein VFD58_13820 [Blastocatellia bacterium]|nr:hypothetical protein [Blastocatellia bacterium]
MALQELFEKFCTEKVYLQNVTPSTLRFYRGSWSVIQRHLAAKEAPELTREVVNNLVISLRQGGQKAKSVNTCGF